MLTDKIKDDKLMFDPNYIKISPPVSEINNFWWTSLDIASFYELIKIYK